MTTQITVPMTIRLLLFMSCSFRLTLQIKCFYDKVQQLMK